VTVSADDALRVVPRIAEIYDEPFADPSQLPTFLVSQIARRKVTVCLTGDGGDELFGGYNRYIEPIRISRLAARVPRPVRTATARVLKAVPAKWADNGVAGLVDLFGGRRISVQSPGRKLHKIAELLATQSPRGAYEDLMTHWRSPPELLGAHAPNPSLFEAAPWSWETFADDAMLWDLEHYLPDNNLAKVDRASMAVSLETRLPLLDHRIVELARRAPPELKIAGGVGKIMLRNSLRRYVPQGLVDRPKMGFSVPIAAWLRGPLREWAGDLLAPDTTRRLGLFEPSVVATCWQEHLSGKSDHYLKIWLVVVAHSWLAAIRDVPAQLARSAAS
jgi:asparagine synthase (glutamine-hydrolysing)